MADAIKLDLTNTPEKFRPATDEILPQLTKLLEELRRLEEQYFVQQKRLHQKGRVIRTRTAHQNCWHSVGTASMVSTTRHFSTACTLAVPLYLP